jgi:hypothetical protein
VTPHPGTPDDRATMGRIAEHTEQDEMDQIGWTFRDPELRAAATGGQGVEFERLELLGDAVADAILLPWIYKWSTGTVAVLSGARQQLVSDASLDHLSLLTGLHRTLPKHVRTSAEHRADQVEAVVGAAFIDGGWDAAIAVCETLFGAWLAEPEGVADRAARIDTAVTRRDRRWHWTRAVWTSGADAPHRRGGQAGDPIEAELDALIDGLAHVGRSQPSVWVEVSDDLLAEMNLGPASPHAARIGELRALLAGFAGVWYVPSERLDTTLDPWSADLAADGVLTPFEASLGHDLVRPALERLALHPSEEQRRLGFVGIGVLKSASTLRAFRSAGKRAHALHTTVHEELALDRLQRAAFAVGLVDLLFPGARPADPVALTRAALGATAVDAGPAFAVDLAQRWLAQIRVADTPLDDLCSIDAIIGGTPDDPARYVDVSLLTPDREMHWRLDDDGVGLHVVALDGISAALDSIDRRHDTRPILIGAPVGVVRAVEHGGDDRNHAVTDAVHRFLGRIQQRGLRVIWHGPVNGSHSPTS